MNNAVPRLAPHECNDRDLADALLSSTARAHETYRIALRRLVHERTDAELHELRDHFDPRRLDDLPPQSGLLVGDIRIACNQELNHRAAWAELDKEIG